MKAKKRIRDVVYHVIVFGIGILMIYPLIWMFTVSYTHLTLPTNSLV